MQIYEILNNYFLSFDEGVLLKHDAHELLFNTTVFKAICCFFPVIASKVKDRFGAIYEADNFYHFLEQVGDKIKSSKLKNNGSAYKPLVSAFEESLKDEFKL